MSNIFDDRGTFKKDGKKYGYYEVKGKRFEFRLNSHKEKMKALKKATSRRR